MSTTVSKDAMEVAEAVQRAVTSMNLEAIGELYADDIVLWHNFDDVRQSGPENLKFLDGLFAKIERLEYNNVHRMPTHDGYVQQHLLEGRCVNGRSFALHACHVVRVRNGQVVAFDEYFDPAPLFAALAD